VNFIIISENRLPPKRKINHDMESVTESDNECNRELDLNVLSSKKRKQSKSMSERKSNVNNNTQKKKSKFK